MKIIHWFVPLFAEQHNLYLEINLNDACNIVAVATQGWRAFQWLLWMGAPCLLICSDLSHARHLGHNRSTIAVVCVFNVILAYFSDFSCVSTFDWPIRQWSVQLAFDVLCRPCSSLGAIVRCYLKHCELSSTGVGSRNVKGCRGMSRGQQRICELERQLGTRTLEILVISTQFASPAKTGASLQNWSRGICLFCRMQYMQYDAIYIYIEREKEWCVRV